MSLSLEITLKAVTAELHDFLAVTLPPLSCDSSQEMANQPSPSLFGINQLVISGQHSASASPADQDGYAAKNLSARRESIASLSGGTWRSSVGRPSLGLQKDAGGSLRFGPLGREEEDKLHEVLSKSTPPDFQVVRAARRGRRSRDSRRASNRTPQHYRLNRLTAAPSLDPVYPAEQRALLGLEVDHSQLVYSSLDLPRSLHTLQLFAGAPQDNNPSPLIPPTFCISSLPISSNSPLSPQPPSPCPPPRPRPMQRLTSTLEQRYHSTFLVPAARTPGAESENRTQTGFETSFESSNSTNLTEASPRSERFTPFHQVTRTPYEVDDYIAECLLKGPEVSNSRDPKLGYVYVHTLEGDKDGGRFVKIGSTSRHPENRRKEISPKNRYGVLKYHMHERQRRFPHYILAEDIVKEELYNQRQKSNHANTQQKRSPRDGPTESEASAKREPGSTEWYEIGKSQANEVVDKWRDWLDLHTPYDWNGSLTAFWRNAIENREPYDKKKHGDMHARWSSILKPPTPWQLTRFWVKQILISQRDIGLPLLHCLINLEKLSRPLLKWLALAWSSYAAYGLLGVAMVVHWMLYAMLSPFIGRYFMSRLR